MKRTISLSKTERQFIKKLQDVLARGPKTLSLFGASGTLLVLKDDDSKFPCVVEDYFEMSCDGGDPSTDEMCFDPEIEYRL